MVAGLGAAVVALDPALAVAVVVASEWGAAGCAADVVVGAAVAAVGKTGLVDGAVSAERNRAAAEAEGFADTGWPSGTSRS
jgi:hypothetical protein